MHVCSLIDINSFYFTELLLVLSLTTSSSIFSSLISNDVSVVAAEFAFAWPADVVVAVVVEAPALAAA